MNELKNPCMKERDAWNKKAMTTAELAIADTNKIIYGSAEYLLKGKDEEQEDRIWYTILMEMCRKRCEGEKGAMIVFALAVLELQEDTYR